VPVVMASGSGAGGVRNLRAMFENGGSQPASPDVRGRSPAARDGDISRPLSKVRTNFVPVEAQKVRFVVSREDQRTQRVNSGCPTSARYVL
jgi:hypothetical protein